MKLSLTLALGLVPAIMGAVPISVALLGFDGLQNGEQVLAYYDGGLGSDGSGPGPNFGVSFTPGLAADATQIAFGPSALLTSSSVTMNLNTPWPGMLSFYFVGNGTVSFYSGPDASGNLLQSSFLLYPPFFPFEAYPGPFESAVFTSSGADALRLDSLEFGAGPVTPEPSVVTLLLLGLSFLAGSSRLRVRLGRSYTRTPAPDRRGDICRA